MDAVHYWANRNLIKSGSCQRCGESKTEWANRDHSYRRDPNDWLELCRSCHRRHDGHKGNKRGKTTPEGVPGEVERRRAQSDAFDSLINAVLNRRVSR